MICAFDESGVVCVGELFSLEHNQKPSHSAGTTFEEEERVSFAVVYFFVNVQFKRRVLEEVVERSF